MTSSPIKLLDPKLEPIAEKVLAGERLNFAEGMTLFETHDLNTLSRLANVVRERKNGDKTYFVHSMRLEFTNICYVGCTFCAFAAHKNEARLCYGVATNEQIGEAIRRLRLAFDDVMRDDRVPSNERFGARRHTDRADLGPKSKSTSQANRAVPHVSCQIAV